ncbi:hypothetical protein LJK88_16170 [Paenibacillus sp. P26]|nr:hypothetical protein LJK88_16170 [Paenibacillus sp. P26]UUZ96645.1 hypothetical protein LJK87_21575 [Paenibacillus sp. P25]
MARYLSQKLVQVIVQVLVVGTLVFSLIHFMPGIRPFSCWARSVAATPPPWPKCAIRSAWISP